jgi:hypothetical protein
MNEVVEAPSVVGVERPWVRDYLWPSVVAY